MTRRKNEATGGPGRPANKQAKGQGQGGPRSARKAGLGGSINDALVGGEKAPRKESKAPKKQAKPAKTPALKAPKVKNVRATYLLPPETVDAVRDAAVHLGGHPAFLNLSKLVNNALHTEVKRLAKKYNEGESFPSRPHDPKSGRPVGS